MTLAEANRIFKFWEQHPPTYLLMAAFVGFKPPIKYDIVGDGSMEAAGAATAEWFENPSRFFH